MKARKFAGYSLLVLGAAGCLLPLIPGIPLILGGAALLGRDHPVVRRWLPQRLRQQALSREVKTGQRL
jgi:uncharacterized protein